MGRTTFIALLYIWAGGTVLLALLGTGIYRQRARLNYQDGPDLELEMVAPATMPDENTPDNGAHLSM